MRSYVNNSEFTWEFIQLNSYMNLRMNSGYGRAQLRGARRHRHGTTHLGGGLWLRVSWNV